MLIQRVNDLTVWLSELIDDARVPDDVKPYVVNVLTRRCFGRVESSSIVLALAHAKTFSDMQSIGDFGFWRACTHGNDHDVVIVSCAKHAYVKCYESTFGRARVYERMANEFEVIADDLHERLQRRYLHARRKDALQ